MELNTIIVIIIFLLGLVIAYYLGSKAGQIRRDRYWENEIPSIRRDAAMRSRAVLGGQFSEQLAPFLPGFPYNPNECRFIGKPIDLIVFKGMDEKDISEVKFVEVKSGNSQLSKTEKQLRDAIQNKRVSWEEYRVDEEVTGRKNSRY